MVNALPGRFTPRNDLVPIEQEAGRATGSVWMGAENFAPTGINPRTVQLVARRYTDYAILIEDIQLRFTFHNKTNTL